MTRGNPPVTALQVEIEYDPTATDPETLASALDRLLETALSTPGLLEEYGTPRVGEFFVARPHCRSSPGDSLKTVRRWALYDLDTARLLTSQVYADRREAAQVAREFEGAVVVPLVLRGVRG